jgi:hypothetical protein
MYVAHTWLIVKCGNLYFLLGVQDVAHLYSIKYKVIVQVTLEHETNNAMK